jgi:Tol biopolymer transport system component
VQKVRRLGGVRSIAVLSAEVLLTFALIVIPMSIPPPALLVKELPYAALTSGKWNDSFPVWSPNGKLLAFMSEQAKPAGIYVLTLADQASKRITPKGVEADNPSWSPDSLGVAYWTKTGSRGDINIAFVFNSSIFSMTSGAYQVPRQQPRWSPDGTRLLFFVSDGVDQLLSVEIATKKVKVVAEVSGGNYTADWLSNSKVIYTSSVQGFSQIWWADLASGTRGVLIGGNATFVSTALAPRAGRFTYITDLVPDYRWDLGDPFYYRQGDFNIWAANLDGTNTSFQFGLVPEAEGSVNLLNFPFIPAPISPNQMPALAPDGSFVAFIADNVLYGESLYLWKEGTPMGTTGSVGPTNSTLSSPSWASDSIHLAFVASINGFNHIFSLDVSKIGMMVQFGANPG